MSFKKIIAAVLTVLILFAGCTKPSNLSSKSEELVAILKVLTSDMNPGYSDEAEGWLVTIDVTGFDENIEDFVLWAEEEYKDSPNTVVLLTGGQTAESFTESDAIEALGDAYSDYALSNWSSRVFRLVEFDEKKQTCTIEVDSTWPMHNFEGMGYSYTLKKNGDAWEISNSEITWIT